MPSWALPVTLLVGGLLLALIRVVFGMDKKAAKKSTRVLMVIASGRGTLLV